jgi:hypothetical protein
VTVVVTQDDRESFMRCRRQWDLQAWPRQNLESVSPPAEPDLPAALHAALAVYYFPGMWDWDRGITLPLVRQGLDRNLHQQRERVAAELADADWTQPLVVGHELLDRYFTWAPGPDRFSPVLIDADFEVLVLDPERPGAGLTDGQQEVRYRGRIHMLAIDEHDAYWLLRHSVLTGGWPATEKLAADEAAVAAAWAWEQFYPGLEIAGTIHNELRLGPGAGAEPDTSPPGRADEPVAHARVTTGPGFTGPASGRPASGAPDAEPASAGPGSTRPGSAARPGRLAWLRGRRAGSGVPARQGWPTSVAPAGPQVRQNEPSGGGRSIPQHRRLYARASETAHADQIVQVIGDGFRRTWIRHSRQDIAAAGLRLSRDAAAMVAAGVSTEPNPADASCRPCQFLQPCLAMRAGRDSEFLLRSGYRQRPPDTLQEGRLGGASWGTGRGAAAFRRN